MESGVVGFAAPEGLQERTTLKPIMSLFIMRISA